MARIMNGMMPNGAMPTRSSGIEKNAARVAIATSQQVTKPAPPPIAPPSTTATVGLGRPSRIASTSRTAYLAGCGGWLCAPGPRDARSAPVQKCLPAPRRTTIRTRVVRAPAP